MIKKEIEEAVEEKLGEAIRELPAIDADEGEG